MLGARLALVGALFVLGIGAAGYAWQRAEALAATAEEQLADQAAAMISTEADTVIAGLGGAAGMVSEDGTVDQISFEAFRNDVAEVTTLDALAYMPLVTEAGRGAFEERTGRQITDLVDSGFVTSPSRPTYAPVEWLGPVDPITSVLIGVDIAASPISANEAAVARDTGATVVTRAVALGEDLTLFFIIKPLYRPGAEGDTPGSRTAAHAGFVASAYSGADLIAGVQGVEPDLRLRLTDETEVIAETDELPGTSAVTRSIEVGGRTWQLAVSDGRGVDHDLSWFLVGITLVLSGALLLLVLRSAAHDRSMNRVVRLVGSTAELGHRLAAAATVQEVAGVISHDVAPALRAASARLTMEDRSDGERPTWANRADVDDRVAIDLEGRRAVMLLDGGDGVTTAQVEIVWDKIRFDDPMPATLQTLAELCEQTFQRAVVTDLIAVRSERLARLAEGLAGAATLDEVSSVITGPGRLPVGAVSASLGVIDPVRGILEVYHGDTVDESVREQFVGPPVTASLAFTDAARTGRPVLLRDMDAYRELYPDSVSSVANLGDGARAALPLRDGDRSIGSVVFAWDVPRVFDDALTSTLSTIAEMATQSVIRASLTETQAEDARHSKDLALLAEQLARVTTVDQLADAVLAHAPTPVGAMTANIGLVENGAVSAAPQPPFPSGEIAQFGVRALEQDLPGMEAIREGTAVVLESLETIGARYPGRYTEAVVELGANATAHLPLLGADSTPLGAIGFAWRNAPAFSATEMSTMRTIAELSSQTLERVRLGEAEHQVVAGLQHRVMSPLAEFEGTEVAGRYLPSASPVGMGGDWYDGVRLDDGRYLLVIGDIAGHGITAVADMIQVRSVVGALAQGDVPLGEVFPRATRLLVGGRDSVTASVAVVIVDAERGMLEYVSAGHPPVLLRHPDGRVETLEDGRQSLLGLPIAEVEPGRTEFAPGAVLIAYTDGLIERRDESIDESITRLVDAVGAASDGPSAEGPLGWFVDAVIERCLGDDDPTDDVALVMIRRTVP